MILPQASLIISTGQIRSTGRKGRRDTAQVPASEPRPAPACHCCSVSKSLPPHEYSTPGFPVLHFSKNVLKLMSIESMMPSDRLILCCPLLRLLSIFPGIRIFSNESALRIRWPNYWSFIISLSRSVLLCTHSLHLVG